VAKKLRGGNVGFGGGGRGGRVAATNEEISLYRQSQEKEVLSEYNIIYGGTPLYFRHQGTIFN
jgi:hypothetical protein